jgi:predicted O-methyltransferase YrrM
VNYHELRGVIEALGVHPVLGPVGQGYNIEQNPLELATLLSSIPAPQTVLEIGTGYRAGLARFLSEHLGCQVTTVDRWEPQTPAPSARQLIGLAETEAIVEQVRGEYDLVVIDADHTYEATRQNYERYAEMGRVVMLHDIAGLRDCEGVAQFWQEISRTKKGHLRQNFHEVMDDTEFRAGLGWVEQ